MRDQRDPQMLGDVLLMERKRTPKKKLAAVYDQNYPVMLRVPDYDGSGVMSADPAEHHSKTPQDVPDDWGDSA